MRETLLAIIRRISAFVNAGRLLLFSLLFAFWSEPTSPDTLDFSNRVEVFDDICFGLLIFQTPFKYIGRSLPQTTVTAQRVVPRLDPSKDGQLCIGLVHLFQEDLFARAERLNRVTGVDFG